MEYNKNEHKFAVIQHGYALYGLGETAEEAKKNSEKWIKSDNIEKLLAHNFGDRIDGKFYLISDPEIIKQYVENQ